MSVFNRKSRHENHEALLDQSLYTVPGTDTTITWADCVEGILVNGATGSGKSSGVGRTTALAMLKANFGFLVLCAKPDERRKWEGYIKAAGREKDMVIFDKASGLQFNFLKYELERYGDGAGDVFNANNALMNLNEQNRQYQSGGSNNNEERFWDNALRYLISMTILLLTMAGEEVSIFNMRKLVANSFSKEEADYYISLINTISTEENIDDDEREQAVEEQEEMQESNYFLRILSRVQGTEFKNEEDIEDVELLEDYWLNEFAGLSERSRSIVVASFMGIIAPFMNRGILKRQFASGLSPELLPENIIAKKSVVLCDFPIKEYGLAGIFASIIIKSVFQGAMERRKIEEEADPKPVCLWIDEAQNYINPQVDALFQATARSSWVSTVMITQNLNGLYPLMGNNQPQARTKSLLGNLNLKFFASNSDYETNHWAAEMIGKELVDLDNLSVSKDMEFSKTKNQQLMNRIQPDLFTTLKTGRKANKYKVETVVFKAGKTWGKKKANYALVEFDQRN